MGNGMEMVTTEAITNPYTEVEPPCGGRSRCRRRWPKPPPLACTGAVVATTEVEATAKPQPDRCPTVPMSLAATGVAARGETDTVKRRPKPSVHHMVRRHFSDVKAEADVQALTEVGARTTTRSSTGTTGVVAMPDTADQIPSIRHLPTPHKRPRPLLKRSSVARRR